MTTLGNAARLGYYPFNVSYVPQIARMVKPEAPGLRLLDPTAGDGEFLITLANAFDAIPYGNELDANRAQGLHDRIKQFGSGSWMNADISDLDVMNFSFSAMWFNPPFMNERSDEGHITRTEMQFFRKAAPWVAKNGLIMYACYPQHLTQDMCEDLYAYGERVETYRIPGKDLNKYMMLVTFIQLRENKIHLSGDNLKQATAHAARAEHNYVTFNSGGYKPDDTEIFPLMSDFEGEPFTFGEPKVTNFRFDSDQLSRDQKKAMFTEAVKQIDHRYFQAPELDLNNQYHAVTSLRARQYLGLIAAGIGNGWCLEIRDTSRKAILKAVTRHISTMVEQESAKPDEGDDDTPPERSKEVIVSVPTTSITLLYRDGEIENITEDEALISFITDHMEQIGRLLEDSVTPTYRFDYMGDLALKEYLAKARLVKGDKKYPLFVPQRHVIAAMLAHFGHQKGLILSGEMGVGKTIMAAQLMGLMRHGGPFLRHVNRRKRMKRGMFNIVTCPSHLVNKWAREIHESIPDVYVHTVASGDGMRPIEEFRRFIKAVDNLPEGQMAILVMSQEMMKFSDEWRSVYTSHTKTERFTGDQYEVLRCPTTGRDLIDWRKADKEKTVYLKPAVLNRNMVLFGCYRSKPKRGMKRRKFAGGTKLHEAFWKNNTPQSNIHRTRLAHRYASTVRDARLKHEAEFDHANYPALWQEERSSNHRLAKDPGELLAERLGTKVSRVLPLPDLLTQHHGEWVEHPAPPPMVAWGGVPIFDANKRREPTREWVDHGPLLVPEEYTQPCNPRAPMGGLAKYIARYYGDRVYMLVVDEAQDIAAGKDSARGAAAMTLTSVAKRVLLATGSIYKGKASEIFPILHAISPDVRKKYRLEDVTEFSRKMGAFQTTRIYANNNTGKTARRSSSEFTERVEEIPGASPELLKLIIPNTVFFGLQDLGEVLPEYSDVGEAVAFDEPMARGINLIMNMFAVYAQMAEITPGSGRAKILGLLRFNTVMQWMNYPYARNQVIFNYSYENDEGDIIKVSEEVGWTPRIMTNGDLDTGEDVEVFENDEAQALHNAMMGTVAGLFAAGVVRDEGSDFGDSDYSEKWEAKSNEVFDQLTEKLPGPIIDQYKSPKEVRLYEMLNAARAKGDRTVVYFHQTGTAKKDMLKFFKERIEANVPGARVGILRSSVSTSVREDWIEKQVRPKKGEGINILICNPNLVKTGLDLIDFNDIIWYELDYSLPTVSQASRRTWRIGQTKTCNTTFLFYTTKVYTDDDGKVTFPIDTYEAIGAQIVGQKQAAAAFINGTTEASLSSLSVQGGNLRDLILKASEQGETLQIADSSSMFQKAKKEEAAMVLSAALDVDEEDLEITPAMQGYAAEDFEPEVVESFTFEEPTVIGPNLVVNVIHGEPEVLGEVEAVTPGDLVVYSQFWTEQPVSEMGYLKDADRRNFKPVKEGLYEYGTWFVNKKDNRVMMCWREEPNGWIRESYNRRAELEMSMVFRESGKIVVSDRD